MDYVLKNDCLKSEYIDLYNSLEKSKDIGIKFESNDTLALPTGYDKDGFYFSQETVANDGGLEPPNPEV